MNSGKKMGKSRKKDRMAQTSKFRVWLLTLIVICTTQLPAEASHGRSLDRGCNSGFSHFGDFINLFGAL